MEFLNFNNQDWILILSLMLIGYIIAEWTKLDTIDNRYIELILLVLGGVGYATLHNDIFKFVIGAIMGIIAAGSYNLLGNLSGLFSEWIKKRVDEGVKNE